MGWCHGTKHIAVLTDDLAGCLWPHTGWGPRPATATDASEAAFVLRHQEKWPVILEGTRGIACYDLAREVFLNAAWAAGSACGWVGRGITLRQPCRANNR